MSRMGTVKHINNRHFNSYLIPTVEETLPNTSVITIINRYLVLCSQYLYCDIGTEKNTNQTRVAVTNSVPSSILLFTSWNLLFTSWNCVDRTVLSDNTKYKEDIYNVNTFLI